MPIEVLPLPLPPSAAIKKHMRAALSRYWPDSLFDFDVVPVVTAQVLAIYGPLRLQTIRLPDWAAHLGVEGSILVPVEACVQGDDWRQIDWWLAAFLLLECWHERAWELQYGPIHSYSYRLQGWDTRAWDYAWVNRIGLFLRAWAARVTGGSELDLFGPHLKDQVVMTHDVDAVAKTLPIRLKQGAFNFFNASRHLLRGKVGEAATAIGKAVRFLFGREDWWTFETLLAQEEGLGLCTHFYFYADTRKKNLRRWLFDPAYDIRKTRIKQLMQRLHEGGGIIGLHATFDAWNSPEIIGRQRRLLSTIAHQQITSCRQHWLRFSWQDTWLAQEAAGIEHDTTLMFNDRSGFRASAVVSWHPWDQARMEPYEKLRVLPTAMMDSHFYDYQLMDARQRKIAMRRWLEEIRAVHGEVAILWHPHSLTRDYGWADGFHELVAIIGETAQ